MGYDRIVYIRYHFSCGLDRKDACWLSFTPLTGFFPPNLRDKNSGVGNQTPRRGEASFHISLLMAGMENASHKNAMDQHLWPKNLEGGFFGEVVGCW